MPHHANIEVTYVAEVSCEMTSEFHASTEEPIELVGKDEFRRLARTQLNLGTKEADKLWDALLGHRPERLNNRNNPNWKNNYAQYFSKVACYKILQHLVRFESGIDFKHLPAGFYMTKHPHTGACEVLHYSDQYKKFQQDVSALAITLPEAGAVATPSTITPFEGNQKAWYHFLLSKRKKTNGDTYCSEEELFNAFIAFSNTLHQLGLTYYEVAPKDLFSEEVNPIVLLGRWETVLTNRHLLKEDVKEQWEVILRLPLTTGKDAIRAITDYENTPFPCRFLIPEMHEKDEDCRYAYFAPDAVDITVNEMFLSQSKERLLTEQAEFYRVFWRFLAFQPRKNSILFYKKSLETLKTIKIDPKYYSFHRDFLPMAIILAEATTRYNHANGAHDVARELEFWTGICKVIDDYENGMLVFIRSYEGQLKKQIIHDLSNFAITPNLVFLHEISKRIKEASENASKLGIAVGLRSKSIDELVQDSNRIRHLLNQHQEKVYQGARFYLDLNTQQWRTLKHVSEYVALAYAMDAENHSWCKVMLAHLSTFNIKDVGEFKTFVHKNASRSTPSFQDKTDFVLSLFCEAENNNGLSLMKLRTFLTEHIPQHDRVELVKLMQQEFESNFKPGFFERQIELLTDKTNQIVSELKSRLAKYNFSPEQQLAIATIQAKMVRQATSIDDLPNLNELFLSLKIVSTQEDFEQFINSLVHVWETCSVSPSLLSLTKLLKLLIQKRTLSAFAQVELRNEIVGATDAQLLDKFAFYIEKLHPHTESNSEHPSLNRVLLQETLAAIILKMSFFDMEQADVYFETIKKIVDNLNTIIRAHTHTQTYLMSYFSSPDFKTEDYLPQMEALSTLFLELNEVLPSSDPQNMKIFYSLLAHHKEKPSRLVSLLRAVFSLQGADKDKKRYLLFYISHQLDAKKDISQFEAFLKQHNETILACLQCPPYPPLNDILKWLGQGNFEKAFNAYSLAPFERKRNYSFNLSRYQKQKKEFKGLEHIFTDEVGQSLNERLRDNRSKSMNELRDKLSKLKLKELNDDEKLELVCLCIEMLARTASQKDPKDANRIIAQELNTTQVMAVYAMIMSQDKKLLSQIYTGEGKTRITMILEAFKALQGMTVDVLTSDMQLAERDYFDSIAFFKALGIESSLITMATPQQLYAHGGVNYSDNSQLVLARNKSDIEGKSFAYLTEDKTKRCLVIDEADKFIHDKVRESFNFAARSERLKFFTWIYPLLVRFVQEEENKLPKSIDDALPCVKPLTEFIHRNCPYPIKRAQWESLKEHYPDQITTWIRSARKALLMERDISYKVSEQKFPVRDANGHTRYSKKIIVCDNGRPAEGCSFSDGVEQCLCVLENLRTNSNDFVIVPENEILRARHSSNFIELYDNVYGVSGTVRSEAPLADPKVNYEKFAYMHIPREYGLNRTHDNCWVAKDEIQHLSFLKRLIKQKLKNKQPVLLICRDDVHSQMIYEYLIQDPELQKLLKKHQRVHALTSAADEKQAIENAGKPCHLTVSTVGMFGRGVDPHAENLSVIAAYTPTFSDEIQIMGRTGRIGKAGDFRLVLDKDELHEKVSYNCHRELFKRQREMELNNIAIEEMSKLFAALEEQITQRFLHHFHQIAASDQQTFLESWRTFLNQLHKQWETCRPILLKAYTEKNKSQFLKQFQIFSDTCFLGLGKICVGFNLNIQASSHETLYQPEQVYDGLLHTHGFFQSHKMPKLTVQQKYDCADDGQARIYSGLFAQTIAIFKGERQLFANTRAWLEGRGVLFADTRALLNGDRPLFANLRAFIDRLLERSPKQEIVSENKVTHINSLVFS